MLENGLRVLSEVIRFDFLVGFVRGFGKSIGTLALAPAVFAIGSRGTNMRRESFGSVDVVEFLLLLDQPWS